MRNIIHRFRFLRSRKQSRCLDHSNRWTNGEPTPAAANFSDHTRLLPGLVHLAGEATTVAMRGQWQRIAWRAILRARCLDIGRDYEQRGVERKPCYFQYYANFFPFSCALLGLRHDTVPLTRKKEFPQNEKWRCADAPERITFQQYSLSCRSNRLDDNRDFSSSAISRKLIDLP